MKQQLESIFMSLRSILLAIATVAMIFGPTSALAATNTANWDIANTPQTAASITINAYNTTNITLTKAAFTTGGAALPDASVVAAGTNVQFMLYIRNAHSFQINDISLSDTLAAADFTMQSANFSYISIAGAAETEANIYTAVTGGGASTATFGNADGDIASYVGNIVNVGTTGGDSQLDIPADTVWAIIFTATVLQ